MRTIIKNIRLPVDGTPYDFRLKKLDAFSGVSLLRMLSRAPQPGAPAGEETAAGSETPDSLQSVLFALPEAELKSLMTACLNHAEVLLPAGYQPVMTGGEWAWPELEYDTVTCLKLTIETVVWTLTGFFGEGGPTSGPAARPSAP